MPTGDLFGSSYSYGDNDGSSSSGAGGPVVGDVVEVAGITGIIMQIVQGVATIQREDGQVEEQAAAQIIVIPPPPTAPAMDWTPIAIGGGIILALLLFVGMRR